MAGHIRSDRERKAMFSKMNNPNDRKMKTMHINSDDNITTTRQRKVVMQKSNQPLPIDVRDFLSSKISKNIKEGKPRDQAIAIAFSQTRKKFPSQAKRLTLSGSSHIDQSRLRSVLISLLGVVIALRVLRELRK